MILGNKVGGSRDVKTYKVVVKDENGKALGTFDCVCDDNEYTQLTATREDVAVGKTFVCDEGICEGTNDFSNCRVTHGEHEVYPGVEFMIRLENNSQWNYTYFTGMIYPKREDGKKIVEKIIMDDGVYDLAGNKVADVTKDIKEMTVRLNMINMTGDIYILSYFTYREGDV